MAETRRTGIRISLDSPVLKEVKDYFESTFPKGYRVIEVKAELFDLSSKIGIAFKAEELIENKEGKNG